MKQFLVTIFIMIWIPTILKCSYLTNSFNSFKFKINLVPPPGFLTIKIGETNSVDWWVVSVIICIYIIFSKITWISTFSSGEKLGFFAVCFIRISFSNSIVSPLTICDINLSDVSFCHFWILGNQRFVIRQKPSLFLLISFRFTLETLSNYNKLLLSKCFT